MSSFTAIDSSHLFSFLLVKFSNLRCVYYINSFFLVFLGIAGVTDPKQQVLSRTIPPAVVEHYLTKISALEGSITEMLEQEKLVSKHPLKLFLLLSPPAMLLLQNINYEDPPLNYFFLLRTSNS